MAQINEMVDPDKSISDFLKHASVEVCVWLCRQRGGVFGRRICHLLACGFCFAADWEDDLPGWILKRLEKAPPNEVQAQRDARNKRNKRKAEQLQKGVSKRNAKRRDSDADANDKADFAQASHTDREKARRASLSPGSKAAQDEAQAARMKQLRSPAAEMDPPVFAQTASTNFEEGQLPPCFKDLSDPAKLQALESAHLFLEETEVKGCNNCGCRWFRLPQRPEWLPELSCDVSFGDEAECRKCSGADKGIQSYQAFPPQPIFGIATLKKKNLSPFLAFQTFSPTITLKKNHDSRAGDC